MSYIYRMDSPAGKLSIASDGDSIKGLWIEGQKYFAAGLKEETEKDLPVFKQAKKWLDCYFSGKEPDFSLPLAPEGSEFRQKVWDILREIPYGQVITYGEIAKRLEAQNGGKKRVSAQAVGGAVGHNPISIIIPCHRVVGTGGSLTGYAGGISIKVKLLELEKTDMEGLFVPKKGTALR